MGRGLGGRCWVTQAASPHTGTNRLSVDKTERGTGVHTQTSGAPSGAITERYFSLGICNFLDIQVTIVLADRKPQRSLYPKYLPLADAPAPDH